MGDKMVEVENGFEFEENDEDVGEVNNFEFYKQDPQLFNQCVDMLRIYLDKKIYNQSSSSQDSNILACPKCNSNFVNKFYTFDILQQINDISKRNKFDHSHLINSKIYQNILENEANNFLTFTINTDCVK